MKILTLPFLQFSIYRPRPTELNEIECVDGVQSANYGSTTDSGVTRDSGPLDK